MALTRGVAPGFHLVHHGDDHHLAEVAGIVEVAHIRTEDAAAAEADWEEGDQVEEVVEGSCIDLQTSCEIVDFDQLARFATVELCFELLV
jgi:hypothetical protein